MEVWATWSSPLPLDLSFPHWGLVQVDGSEVLALHGRICIGSEGQVPRGS